MTSICRHQVLNKSADGNYYCAFCNTIIQDATGKKVVTTNNNHYTPPQNRSVNTVPKQYGAGNEACLHDYQQKNGSYVCSKCGTTIPIKGCGCGAK